MATTSTPSCELASSPTRSVKVLSFVNRPKLRKHNKSRKGCLACKTRRVKCSETSPICSHCNRLGLNCTYPHHSTLTTLAASPRDQPGSPVSLSKGVVAIHHRKSPIQSLGDCIMLSTIETREQDAVLQSLHFFNTCFLPEFAQAHAPFQRTLISASHWLKAPRVIQTALVVLTKAMQRSRSFTTPANDKDFLHFRSISLTELTALVADVSTNCQAVAFDCIQLVMLTEMQLEPVGPWAYHLEAARRLIDLQDGLGSLFYKKPAWRNLLINYMEIDILTTTTCSSRLLNTRDVEVQSTYIPLLAHREEEAVTTACFSPIQLLQAIIDTNKLHLRQRREQTFALKLEFNRIQENISAFDPSPWAIRILNYGSVLPRPASTSPSDEDISAMISLALCHQAAATLYLHLSCGSDTEERNAKLLSPTHHILTANLAKLLAQSSLDTEGPIHTQLHKFAIWPLFAAAYARVGWDVGACVNECDSSAERDLERLRFAAIAIRSWPLMVAVGVMESVRTRRAARSEGQWAWDDAFQARCSFCVLWMTMSACL